MSIEFEVPLDPFSKPNNISQGIHEMAPFQKSPQPPQQDLDSDINMQGMHQQGSRTSSPTSSMGSSSASPNLDTSNEYPIDLSSDDSSCMTSEYYSEQRRQHTLSNPLHELQNSLTRNGFLGQSLSNGISSIETGARNDPDSSNRGIDRRDCHICTFKGSSEEEYNRHIDSHFEHKCPICDYTSRTEGRLSRHIHDFHSQVPPESWAGRKKCSPGKSNKVNAEASSSSASKPKLTKCKQCSFTCDSKSDYYTHLEAAHLKKEKILKCTECSFVTEYKHHMEYHLRNHYGSKPFKCTKCNYICVNKSMLNSHKKSHSKFFPYRCADCKYATKYCHSLKVHRRKYNHQPGQVLNSDGTPNQMPIIDVYGRRRGPKDKSVAKSKSKSSSSKSKTGSYPTSNSSDDRNAIPNQSFMYHPYFPTNTFSSMLMLPPSGDMQMPPFPLFPGKPFKCYYCDFVTDSRDLYQQHLVAHAARENSDLIRTCNINPDVFHVQAQHLTFNNYPQNAIHYAENSPKILSKDNSLTQNNHTSSSDSNSTRHVASASLSVAPNNIPSNTISPTDKSVSTGNSSSTTNNVKNFSAGALTNNREFNNNREFQSTNNTFSQQSNAANSRINWNNFIYSTPQQDSTLDRKPLNTNASVFSQILKKTNGLEISPNNVNVSNNQVIPSMHSQKDESLSSPHQEFNGIISYTKNDSQSGDKESSALSRCSPFSERSFASNCSQRVENSPKMSELTDNYSPLDLSNAKPNSPTETSGKDSSSVQRSDASTSESSPQSGDGFSSQSRNRRKGKAFKLDQFIQWADSPVRLDTNGQIDSPHDNGIIHTKTNSGSSVLEYLGRTYGQRCNEEAEEIEKKESDNIAMQHCMSRIKEFTRLANSSQNVRLSRSSGSPRHFESDFYVQQTQEFPRPSRMVNAEDGYRSKIASPTALKVEQESSDSLAENVTDSSDDGYLCSFCETIFKNCAMYTIHMGFHGFSDPYTCNKCGNKYKNNVDFYLHLVRISHT